MGLADTANLIVDLSLKGNFSSQLAANRRALTGFDKQITDTQGRAYKAGQQIGTGIKRGAIIAAGAIGFLGSQVLIGIKQLAQLEDATAATNAALKSTKSVSGQTAASIRNLAEKYEALNATIDDKVIQSGENVLLTFTAIRKEAFEPALAAALDLSVGMKQDLQTSIVQVGKALNDPIKGLTSLSRIGVRFTDQQKDQIKALIKTGDLLGAQKIILRELGTEFGGRFAAQGKTATGTIAGIGDAVEDLQKALATALFPTVQKILPKIRAALADPKVVATIERLGQSIADLFSDANIAEGGKILGTVFDTAKAAAPVLKDAAVATLGVVKAAVSAFRSLPPEIQKLAIGAFAINKLTGGLVTNIAGGLISAVISSFKGMMNVNAAVVNVNGGIGGVPGVVGGGGGGILGNVLKAVPWIAAGTLLATGFLQGNANNEADRAAGRPLFYGTGNAPAKFGGTGMTKMDPNVTAGGFDKRLAGSGIIAGVNSALKGVISALARPLSDFNKAFQDAVKGLKTATKPADVQKAVAAALAVVTKRGGATATGKVLVDLKNQLVHTTDPATRRILKDAIGKVEHKLVGRALVQKQLDKADEIAKSGKSTAQKLADLKTIEKSLEHTSRSGAAKVQAKMEAVRKAAKYAGQQAAAAIKDKDLSIGVTIPVNVTATVTNRESSHASATFSRVFNNNLDRRPT